MNASYQCPASECDKAYSKQCNLDDHIRSVHSGETPFKCDECGKGFARQRNLQQHLLIHSPDRPHKCSFPGCEKSFRHRGQLRDHERRHSEPKPFQCDAEGCTESFSKHNQLHRHVAIVHNASAPYPCPWEGCEAGFPTPSKLKKHLARHENPVMYVCPHAAAPAPAPAVLEAVDGMDGEAAFPPSRMICATEGFPTWSALQAHLRTAHALIAADGTPGLPHVCPDCGNEFKTRWSTTQHMARAHPPDDGAPPPAFPCIEPGCDASLSSKSNLRAHVRQVHRGIKPFECPHCGRSFSTRQSADRHVATIHAVRSDAAAAGGLMLSPPRIQTTVSAEDEVLLAEIAGYGVERPIACEHCPRRFKRDYDRALHMRAAHPLLVVAPPTSSDSVAIPSPPSSVPSPIAGSMMVAPLSMHDPIAQSLLAGWGMPDVSREVPLDGRTRLAREFKLQHATVSHVARAGGGAPLGMRLAEPSDRKRPRSSVPAEEVNPSKRIRRSFADISPTRDGGEDVVALSRTPSLPTGDDGPGYG
ncbi:hypothetical protein BC828DRAFT_403909 [Blastocladiella britannica]|nr:hypothetical protein BC828DRAFT_403909 [Blastocladiella britannica]